MRPGLTTSSIPDAYPLSRFGCGERLTIWQKGSPVHGRTAVSRENYALTEGDLLRVYYDSGAGFMTEAEFAVLEVMTS